MQCLYISSERAAQWLQSTLLEQTSARAPPQYEQKLTKQRNRSIAGHRHPPQEMSRPGYSVAPASVTESDAYQGFSVNVSTIQSTLSQTTCTACTQPTGSCL